MQAFFYPSVLFGLHLQVFDFWMGVNMVWCIS